MVDVITVIIIAGKYNDIKKHTFNTNNILLTY